MKYSVLLVEDDKQLASLVKDYLEQHEFDVFVEHNGQRAQRQCQQLNPSLVILDVMLPGLDGLSICQNLRPEFRGPIIMLTARNQDIDQILGLEFGADDYVIKPADPRILLARLRALVRRYYHQGQSADENIAFGTLCIQPASRSVSLEGAVVSLSSHEYDLLLCLAQKAGQIIGRDFLFHKIYQREYDGLDRTIDVRISQLRKKLNDNSDNPTRIKTIWGKGYLFVADAWNS